MNALMPQKVESRLYAGMNNKGSISTEWNNEGMNVKTIYRLKEGMNDSKQADGNECQLS